MLTSYPYADPQYGGILTYGAPVKMNLTLEAEIIYLICWCLLINHLPYLSWCSKTLYLLCYVKACQSTHAHDYAHIYICVDLQLFVLSYAIAFACVLIEGKGLDSKFFSLSGTNFSFLGCLTIIVSELYGHHRGE